MAPVVVGHQPLRADAVGGEEAQRPVDERGDGRRFRVREQLGVGEPGVVVDDCVRVVVADPRFLLGGGRAAVAGERVPGPLEAASSSSESSQTHSLEGGPDALSAVHNLCRHVVTIP